MVYPTRNILLAAGKEITRDAGSIFPVEFLGSQIPVTPELCYILGVMIGDGGVYTYKGHNKIDFVGGENKEFVENIAKIVRKTLDIKVAINKHYKANCWYAQNFEKTVCLFFRNLGMIVGNKIYTSKLPDWVHNLTPLFSLPLIEGLIDAEGTVYIKTYKRKTKNYQYPHLDIKMRSSQLMSEISELLHKLEIDHSFFFDNYNKQHKIIIEGSNFSKLKKICKFSYKFKNSTVILQTASETGTEQTEHLVKARMDVELQDLGTS